MEAKGSTRLDSTSGFPVRRETRQRGRDEGGGDDFRWRSDEGELRERRREARECEGDGRRGFSGEGRDQWGERREENGDWQRGREVFSSGGEASNEEERGERSATISGEKERGKARERE